MILLNNDETTELFKRVVGKDFWNKANKELNSTKGVLFLEYVDDENRLYISMDSDTIFNQNNAYIRLAEIKQNDIIDIGDITIRGNEFILNDWSKQDIIKTWHERGNQIKTDIVNFNNELYCLTIDGKLKNSKGLILLDLMKLIGE
jgi:hypothetical protein